MRAALAAAVAAGLLLAGTGCGSGSAAPNTLGQDAAALVPADALAFAAADSNLDSDGWRTIRKLIGGGGDVDPDFVRDLPAAVGDELNLAVLGVDNGKPEYVAIVKPRNEAKLRTIAAKYSRENERYSVKHVAGWSVVADSEQAFQAVRAAASGSSLADDASFRSAMSQLDDDALANVYVNAAGVQQLPAKLRALAGRPRWAAAQLAADKDVVQLDLHADDAAAPKAYEPTLLRDVPSGAILAVSFKNLNQLLARLPSLPSFLAGARSIDGEGVLYVVPGALLPVITLEVEPHDPTAAVTSLRAIAAKISNTLPLSVERHGSKVFLTTAAPGLTSDGKSLVDDRPFKDALDAADVPDEVTWLAYADVQRLAPLLQAFGSLLPTKGSKLNLEISKELDTLVAFGARSGSLSRLRARITIR